jgi:ABC-type cobalamin/Fe3+-siderophores transport system ATPase subunit
VSAVLKLDGVWTAFDRGRDRVSVFEDASLTIDEGEIVAVVAGAGQGKTTLIRLASGTLPPDRGVVRVAGVDLSQLKDKQLAAVLASEVGIATGAGPGVGVTVREYVEMAAGAPKVGSRRRWRRRERRRMTTAQLDELGIASCASQQWDELSDWQRVLVDVAQAVVVRPRLLLLDDLADGFGLRQKQELMAVLEAFARQHECGILTAVADHGSALRAVRVWRVHHRELQLMADHTDADVDADADVIQLRPKHESGDTSPARRHDA